MNPLALASSSKRALDSLMTLGVKLFFFTLLEAIPKEP